MTKERGHGRLWLYLAVLLSTGQVALIWLFRFVPVNDYPKWLHQAQILADLVKGGSVFAGEYAIRSLPVPNATFSILVAILGQVLYFEVAGKLMLTISVLLFPWGFWFASRRFGATPYSAVPYMGFPFAVSMFALNVQNYTLALGLLFWFLGLFGTLLERQSRTMWVLMSGMAILIFLTHGVIYLVLLLLLFIWTFKQSPRTRLWLGVTVAPSLLLAIWYLLAEGVQSSAAPEWGMTVFARHFVKPGCIFFKSHGITPLWPPTYLNLAWIVMSGIIMLGVVVSGIRSRTLHTWLAAGGGALLVVALVLPDHLYGVVQPGARLVFPACFLVLLCGSGVRVMAGWRPFILGFGVLALGYNVALFRAFDARASELTASLQVQGSIQEPVYIIALDWAVDADASSKIAPSVNAMSFVPLYTFSERGIPTGIFETGLVTMQDSLRRLHPEISGSNLSTWFASVFSDPSRFAQYGSILLFGEGEIVEDALKILREIGFVVKTRKPGWFILGRDVK